MHWHMWRKHILARPVYYLGYKLEFKLARGSSSSPSSSKARIKKISQQIQNGNLYLKAELQYRWIYEPSFDFVCTIYL
ncbi:hypothetical protein F441_15320 [Phytophthora nicotianae CJ01A1]|uniref:Uncharacterized protein n=6 Tax=Phytophthora nicotianae TaxID=4792 RepID=V9EI55_PHYNI|nr:hypothetical protein F443_15492 [Phytophthora nicotianae P1569]ETK79057.1 hypothetical protein L915_15055 [Phytophthora nicotianae]ETL32473.1 hypothetical protein L916_14952 [Phytophthora nicotianae]ETP08747.1 hypothetical protein F441_15320 [Phytophthora nicotianae CJ01A1]ETP36786.1 hypothetical protein F442_15348 [Phytophthora nicotianae P10297]